MSGRIRGGAGRRISLVLWIVRRQPALRVHRPLAQPAADLALAWVKVGVIGSQLVGILALRGPLRRNPAIAVGIVSGSGASVGGLIAGLLVQDPFTTPMLCTAAALLTAAVIPWGSSAQAAATLMNLVAASLTVYLVAGFPTAREPILGMIVVSGLSVYIAHELARQRAAEARATLALQRHQAEVAHVLRVSALGEMAAQLAHELTQPLGAIANYAAGCRRRLEGTAGASPEIIDVVDRIAREALRAGAIIRRMREFLQKSEPQRRSVDVNALVREVAELIDGEARERGVAVELELHRDLPAVEADGVEIEQVLINLARNALEAMQGELRPPRLAIETRIVDPQIVEVFVRDSGRPANGSAADLRAVLHHQSARPRHGIGDQPHHRRAPRRHPGGDLGSPVRLFRFTLPVKPPASVRSAAAPLRQRCRGSTLAACTDGSSGGGCGPAGPPGRRRAPVLEYPPSRYGATYSRRARAAAPAGSQRHRDGARAGQRDHRDLG
jgi:signal transduction histidine kinase